MRRGRDYRLNTALRALKKFAPTWTPPPGERETDIRSGPLGMTGPVSGAHDDELKVIERQWIEIVAGMLGVSELAVRIALPGEQVFYLKDQRLNAQDQILSRLSEEETHALAEEAALHEQAAVSQAEIAEAYDIEPRVYSHRWTRVSDAVFQQYGRLEDRRPA